MGVLPKALRREASAPCLEPSLSPLQAIQAIIDIVFHTN